MISPIISEITAITYNFRICWLNVYYGNSPKISYTKGNDKMADMNRADPDQTAPDLGLHCLPFHKEF